MAVEEKKTSDLLEETDRGIKPRGRIKNPRYINITLTPFQYAQIDALCEIGVASTPTNFTRMAIIELVRQNKHFLPTQMLPPSMKPQTPDSKKKRK